MSNNNKKINFTIDKNKDEIEESQDPVTGAFLRNLPPVVSDEYDLYLRARGREDDLLIKPEDEVEVKNGDHFYTSKRVITPGAV